MQHRSLTIMFTDMKGFTPRTSTQSRAATLDMIRRHKELMLPVIEGYGGVLVKGIGDAFLVTFESPTDAVLAGMALQETMGFLGTYPLYANRKAAKHFVLLT